MPTDCGSWHILFYQLVCIRVVGNKYDMTSAYILHQLSQCRNEPERVAVYHGTLQYHHDTYLLRTRNVLFRKGLNGTADCIAASRTYHFLLPPNGQN